MYVTYLVPHGFVIALWVRNLEIILFSVWLDF